jgi:hypothetical protein
MANIPIYPGSSSFFPGDTPFAFYDNDLQFQEDADKVTTFCARRLGYPIVEVELQDINFYAAFEEAITTYGNEVYAYKVRQDYLTLEGGPTGSNFNNTLITPNMGTIVRLSEQYGEEAGSGGNVTWRTGSLALQKNVQRYDLNAWAAQSASLGTNDSIEIKRIFYYPDPAVVRYFDPYASSGMGFNSMMDSFGFGSFSPSINFMLMPLNFDLQRLQAIEMNDQVRKSNYSFELINNQLKIFPIPGADGEKLYFEYIKTQDRYSSSFNNSYGGVTNVSNVPYTNPSYQLINSVGRSWIFEYTLALCKEMLGYVRGKFSTVPIPDSEVTLNQSDLIAAATAEKTALIERLRGYLEETSREKLLERRAQEAEFKQTELSSAPYTIYVG